MTATGRGELPLPPHELRLGGDDDDTFRRSGEEVVSDLSELCALRPDSALLELGSGDGRLAHALWRDGFDGPYLGLDPRPEQVDWCRETLSPSSGGVFEFGQLDLAAERLLAAVVDRAVDVSLVTGVLTDLGPAESERCLAELARVMRPGARALARVGHPQSWIEQAAAAAGLRVYAVRPGGDHDRVVFERTAASQAPAPSAPPNARADANADYILRFQPLCDRYLAPIADPQGKRVLVLGTGHGTEMLWAARGGAREVVGVDPAERNLDTVHLALEKLGETVSAPLELIRTGAERVHELGREFDLVISLNVFEHLPDVPGALRAAARVIRPHEGRIAVFTDPLYNSSAGAHLPIEPWQHLWDDPATIRAAAPSPYMRREYESLNGMTLAGLVDAVRSVGLVILRLNVVVDRNIATLPEIREQIDPRISTTDLALEGIQCELMRI